MTPQEYNDASHYIKRNLEVITTYAVETAIKEKLDVILNEYRNEVEAGGTEYAYDELDHWHSFGDRVDLNYVSRNLTELRCLAYPVVNGVPNYDEEYEIELPFPKDWNN